MDKNKNHFLVQNTRFSKRTFLLVGLVMLFVGYVASAYFMHLWPFMTSPAEPTSSIIDTDKPSEDQLQTAKDIKKQSVEKTTQSGASSKGTSSQSTTSGSTSAGNKSVNAQITAANQTDSELLVRVLIQTISNTGECTLALSSGSTVLYTSTAGVQALPNESTCKGFNIPLNKLPKGPITVNVEYTDGDVTANTSTTVEIK